MIRFTNWLKSKKGVIEADLYFDNNKDGVRGTFSRRDIPEGEEVLVIPDEYLIHSGDLANPSKHLKEIMEDSTLGVFGKNIQLTVFILNTMNSISFSRKLYYTTFPKILDNIPIFWSIDEMGYLKGSSLLNTIQSKIKQIREEFNKITFLDGFNSSFTFEEYKRVRSLVSSRNFSIRYSGKKEHAMVPWADMLNHSSNPNIGWIYIDDPYKKHYKCFVMVAKQNIPKGEEILDTYGLKSNEKYLMDYGFVVDTPPIQSCSIFLFADTFTENIHLDINGKKKLDLIRIKEKFLLTIPINESVIASIIRYAAIAIANKTDIKIFFSNKEAPIPDKLKKLAIKVLIHYFEKWLETYLTTPKQDNLLMDNYPIGSNVYSALLIIGQEKEIIQKYLTFLINI